MYMSTYIRNKIVTNILNQSRGISNYDALKVHRNFSFSFYPGISSKNDNYRIQI